MPGNGLPPVQAMRALEAASRHLSYTRAAEELSLTHGAVSHQVARLERDLGGVRLFVRDGQQMVPTEAGRLLALDVRRAFRILDASFAKAAAGRARDKARRALAIGVLPSFASRWLIPRLPLFRDIAPDVDVHIAPSTGLASMDGRDGIDLSVRYGVGGWHGVRSVRLVPGALVPVASPVFARHHAIREHRDLLGVPLLRCPRDPWHVWFSHVGLPAPEAPSGLSVDDAGMLIQLAVDGHGVGLVRTVLAADEMEAGRLVRLFDEQAEDGNGWYLCWREPVRCDADAHDQFRAWLAEELQQPG